MGLIHVDDKCRVVRLYLETDHSVAEISRMVGVSVPAAHAIIRRQISKLWNNQLRTVTIRELCEG